MSLEDNNTKENSEELEQITVNAKVTFSSSNVAKLLRKLEQLLGIPLSIRSTNGEVICKTDYFYGPCSFIRGTELGCTRCRKVYASIENKIFRRKVPFACLCYAGFLIFTVPLEFRGEMLGFLIGSQIIPGKGREALDKFNNDFKWTAKGLGLTDNKEFLSSFDKIKFLDDDKQRVKFLSYLEEIGRNFFEMALSEKSWRTFLKGIKSNKPEFGKL